MVYSMKQIDEAIYFIKDFCNQMEAMKETYTIDYYRYNVTFHEHAKSIITPPTKEKE